MRAKFVIVSRPRDRSVVLNKLLSKEPAGSDTVLLLHECDPRAVLPRDAIESWLQKPRPVIDPLLPQKLIDELVSKGYATQPHRRESDSRGFFVRGQVYEDKGQTAVHTAADVPISAYSSTSQVYRLFYGVQENTDVFFKLMRAALGGFD